MSVSRCKALREKFFAELGRYPYRSRAARKLLGKVTSEWRKLKRDYKRERNNP